MNRNLTYMFYFVLFVLVTTSLYAQDSIATIESVQQELIDARDGIDYSGDIIEEKEKEKEKEENEKSRSSDFNFSDIASLLLIISLVGIVFAILYFMLGKENVFRPKSTKIKELNLKAIEQIEENLEEHDVDSYLQQAISKRQFRIAIRLHYLLIIKELSGNKFIKWKRDKTNRNYLIETESYAFSDNFKKSTSIFEKVWYGERSIDEQAFNMIHGQFNALRKEINTTAI